jgi:hypothetical protein
MLNSLSAIKINSHLALGDQQMLEPGHIFRKRHHFFTVAPVVNILGFDMPLGRTRQVELDMDTPHFLDEQLDKIKAKPSFADAAAALVLAQVMRTAQFSDSIYRVPKLVEKTNTIEKMFIDNFGIPMAHTIMRDAGKAYFDHKRNLPADKERLLKLV